MSKRPLIAAILALPLAACATVPPVEVTRFHIDNPARSGTLAVEEMPGNPDVSLEFRTYAAAVQQHVLDRRDIIAHDEFLAQCRRPLLELHVVQLLLWRQNIDVDRPPNEDRVVV